MKRDIIEKQSTFSKLRNSELTTINLDTEDCFKKYRNNSLYGMIKLFEIIISVKMAYNESRTVGVRQLITIIKMKPSLSC